MAHPLYIHSGNLERRPEGGFLDLIKEKKHENGETYERLNNLYSYFLED
jgi:hypothetical protein